MTDQQQEEDAAYLRWVNEVEGLILGATGTSVLDLPDEPYRDWFDYGMEPNDAVEEVLKHNGFKDLPDSPQPAMERPTTFQLYVAKFTFSGPVSMTDDESELIVDAIRDSIDAVLSMLQRAYPDLQVGVFQ